MNLSGRPIRSAFIGLLLAFAALAPTCLNDRDTLADEAKKNRDILTTLVGGFDRNPPLYYEMRIKRIEHDLKANPKLIDEYDDIAVANDRIGNDDEAIKWIEAKKKQLAPLDMGSETSKDQWYRYYANCGTFWVHRWGRNGADPTSINEVKRGRDLIDRALVINPNAHFGREKFQRLVMSWLIDTRTPNAKPADPYSTTPSLAEYVQVHMPGSGDYQKRRQEAIVGLTGLIRLGGAWQSPDIYWAIGSLFQYPQQAMGQVCMLRAKEIMDSNKEALELSPQTMKEQYVGGPDLDEYELAEYKRLRNLAEKWNADRQAFMMAKLKKGDHPDTDPHFWDGAPPMPTFTVRENFSTWWDRDVMSISHRENALAIVVLAVPVVLLGLLVRRAFRRRRELTSRLDV